MEHHVLPAHETYQHACSSCLDQRLLQHRQLLPTVRLFVSQNCSSLSRSNESHQSYYLHVSDCVALPAQLAGTVYDLSGSLSQATMFPSDPLIRYLYFNVVSAGRLTVANQSGSLLVYLVALSATADAVFQLPSCGMLPVM